MSSSEPDAEGAPGGASSAARVLACALDKVIKHSSWRRHAALVAASKSALDLLSSAPTPGPDEPSDSASPVPGLPAPAADAALGALLLALDLWSPKVASASRGSSPSASSTATSTPRTPPPPRRPPRSPGSSPRCSPASRSSAAATTSKCHTSHCFDFTC
ncbi:hypothetical protein GQ55_3G290000 [Panicum hallii var. hallii]|uniref:Uncharacterized protein n=1 Tax=Panicum hallii var. hallii TaxID=1504633 RepID=A0A2T7EEG5_9POAL|nr:hypothetical protein GQ55_3G290000 [Panicum hallii var. hallii]